MSHQTERKSWYADRETCVRTVHAHLRRVCEDIESDKSFGVGHLADLYATNAHRKTRYICNVAVDQLDAFRAVSRLGAAAKDLREEQAGATVTPILAIPTTLILRASSPSDWGRLKDLCISEGVGLWLIDKEQVERLRVRPLIDNGVATVRGHPRRSSISPSTAEQTTAAAL